MAQTDYAIHDVQVRDTLSFGLSGTAQTKTIVTYYVGSHGPFTLTYNKDQATSAQIRNDMETQARDLRAINGEV